MLLLIAAYVEAVTIITSSSRAFDPWQNSHTNLD
jgi:hypothetical protein